MRARFNAAIVITMLALLQPLGVYAQPTDDAARWRAVVSALEPAAFVSVRLKQGPRMKGTVIAAGPESFTFLPRTRIPVPTRTLRYEDLAALERAHTGTSPGVKVLIGAGATVGGLLLLLVTALALSND